MNYNITPELLAQLIVQQQQNEQQKYVPFLAFHSYYSSQLNNQTFYDHSSQTDNLNYHNMGYNTIYNEYPNYTQQPTLFQNIPERFKHQFKKNLNFSVHNNNDHLMESLLTNYDLSSNIMPYSNQITSHHNDFSNPVPTNPPSTNVGNTTNTTTRGKGLVVWDFENMKVPKGVSIQQVVAAINSHIISRHGSYLEKILAIGDFHQLPPEIQSQLKINSVTLQHVPQERELGKKNQTDFVIVNEILDFTLRHHGDHQTIVIISDDKDFAMFAATLVKHGRDVHIMYARQTRRHENLPGHIKYFSWYEVIGLPHPGSDHNNNAPPNLLQAPESPERMKKREQKVNEKFKKLEKRREEKRSLKAKHETNVETFGPDKKKLKSTPTGSLPENFPKALEDFIRFSNLLEVHPTEELAQIEMKHGLGSFQWATALELIKTNYSDTFALETVQGKSIFRLVNGTLSSKSHLPELTPEHSTRVLPPFRNFLAENSKTKWDSVFALAQNFLNISGLFPVFKLHQMIGAALFGFRKKWIHHVKPHSKEVCTNSWEISVLFENSTYQLGPQYGWTRISDIINEITGKAPEKEVTHFYTMHYGDKTVSSYLSVSDLTFPPFYAQGHSISLTLHSVPVTKPPVAPASSVNTANASVVNNVQMPAVTMVPITNEQQVKPKVEDLSSFLNNQLAMPEGPK